MNQEVIVHLSSYNLKTITLFNNPWYCNCFLQHSINNLKEKNLLTSRETCYFPESLRGKTLINLSPDDIDCKPKVFINPDESVKFINSGENFTLSCKIFSNEDGFFWTFNKEPISNCLLENLNDCNQGYANTDSQDFGVYTLVNISKYYVSTMDSGLYG